MSTHSEFDAATVAAAAQEVTARVVPGEIPVPAIYREPRRYQIRFPSPEAFAAAKDASAPTKFRVALEVPRRATIALQVPASVAGPLTALQNEIRTLQHFMHEYGATVMEDYEYAMDAPYVFEEDSFLPPGDPPGGTLDDVVKRIGADRCRDTPMRDDVVIAVVDSGIDGRQPEFPESVRAGAWAPPEEDPWTDWNGHGTMCAAIAAGSRKDGGRFDGIAPGARLISCKTWLRDTELAGAYDYLIEQARTRKWRIVATNSFGIPSEATPPPANSAFMETLGEAIAAGIAVVFSAGNYHRGDPRACEPTSIWHYKCHPEILTVAACTLDGVPWAYSSRGPGREEGSDKPDVMAPTPAYGAVLYGDSIRVLKHGWGTSGAAPQAAGLAALLISQRPELTSSEVFGHIRASAAPVSGHRACEGHGMIDCRAALDRT